LNNVVSDLRFSRHPLPFDFLLPRSVLEHKGSISGAEGSQERYRGAFRERSVSEPSAASVASEVDAKLDIETVKAKWMMRPLRWASSFFTGLTGTDEKGKPKKNSKSVANSLEEGGEYYNALRKGGNGEKSPVNIQGGRNEYDIPPLHNGAINEDEKFRRGEGNHINFNSGTTHRLESTEDLNTTGVMDWLTRERAHSGFLRLYLSVRNSLFAALDPLLTSDVPATSARRQKDCKRKVSQGKRKVSMSMRPLHFRRSVVSEDSRTSRKRQIFITGHSLGGALATLAALDLQTRYTGEYAVRMINLASPRVGDYSFARMFDSLIPNAVRVVFTRDVVPGLPKFGCMFKHVGHEVNINKKGNALVDPSAMEKTFVRNHSSSFKAHSLTQYEEGIWACLAKHLEQREAEFLRELLCSSQQNRNSVLEVPTVEGIVFSQQNRNSVLEVPTVEGIVLRK